MKFTTDFIRRNKLAGFSFIFLLSAVLAGFLLSWIWHPDEKKNTGIPAVSSVKSPAKTGRDMINLAILTHKLNTLQQLDKEYAGLLKSGDTGMQMAVNKMIEQQEASLNFCLDSMITKRIPQPDSSVNVMVDNFLAAYKSMLNNRTAIGTLRNKLNVSSVKRGPNDIETLLHQDLLQEKKDSIMILLYEMRSMRAINKGARQKTDRKKPE